MSTEIDSGGMDASSPIANVKVDYSTTCDEKIPQSKSMASEGKVQEALDQLMGLVKQTSNGFDMASTSRVMVAIVQICFEAKQYSALNEQVILLAKRSQFQQAVVKMVQECLTYIDKIMDNLNKINLIKTLKCITEGRTYLKEEKAMLKHISSKIKQEENTPSVAAKLIQEVMDEREVRTKRRKPLSRESKEILFNLYKYFKANNDKNMSSITTSSQLVAASSGIPLVSVKRVLVEGKRASAEGKPFSSPKKKKCKEKLNVIDDFDKAVIRKTIILNYYNSAKEFLSIKHLHEKMKNEINYLGSITSLRKELSLLGFKRKITENNCGIFVEKQEIRYHRINFLIKIAEYRLQGRPIVFTDETYLDTSHLYLHGDSFGSNKSISKRNGLIIIHAGGMDGYVPNALLMFEANQNNGDHLGNLNNETYINWMKNQLIPNLKPNSVVVVDNSPYHNIIHNPAPNSYARKQEMIDWLNYRNIVHSSSMLKPQLYQLILQNKDNVMEYKIDNLLKEYNHSVLRLPPSHPEFNPVQKIWAMIKEAVENNKVVMDTENIMKLVKEIHKAIPLEEWQNVCNHAIKEENKFGSYDAVIDAVTERLTMNVSDTSEESESEYDTATMSESE